LWLTCRSLAPSAESTSRMRSGMLQYSGFFLPCAFGFPSHVQVNVLVCLNSTTCISVYKGVELHESLKYISLLHGNVAELFDCLMRSIFWECLEIGTSSEGTNCVVAISPSYVVLRLQTNIRLRLRIALGLIAFGLLDTRISHEDVTA
jgi:hypothetical protein